MWELCGRFIYIASTPIEQKERSRKLIRNDPSSFQRDSFCSYLCKLTFQIIKFIIQLNMIPQLQLSV